VREPFKELVAELLPEVQKLDPEITMEAKDALFRINRDMRFSKHNYPYKAHMAAGFTRDGRKSALAGYYIQIGKKLTAIGGGLPYLDREVLRKIRIAIGYRPERFNSCMESTEFQRLFGSTLLGEMDDNLPKSFYDVAEELPVIKKKQFYYAAFYYTKDIMMKPYLVQFITDHFKAGIQLNNFLIDAVLNFRTPINNKTNRRVLEH